MTEDEFVEKAFLRLPVVDSRDYDDVERGIRQLFQQGIAFEDAVRITYLTEDVSPQFSEEYALAQMKLVYDKYPNKHECY